MSDTRKTVIVVGSIVSALLVATIIVVGVLIYTVNKQAESDAYRACMATMGVGPGGDVTDVDEMVEAAEWCSR